jgi:sulfate adenylyltransferase (ADP) / ATP adenylyltransferase
VDPFENPSAELLVAEVPKNCPSHILVLNKYPVIANHFILATKTSRPQTDMLEEDDIAVTHACLKSWETGSGCEGPRRLFAFFNSGELSGASQAHRHLQFLPFEDMAAPNERADWKLLIDGMSQSCGPPDELLSNPSLPFCHHALDIPPSASSRVLHEIYERLYDAALSSAQSQSGVASEPDTLTSSSPKAAAISYNLAMTATRMAICPRRSEYAVIPSSDGESSVAVNGTILGGTLMVKDEVEWQSLQNDSSLLDKILTSIGVATADAGGQTTNKL